MTQVTQNRSGPVIITVLVLVLLVLHQDNWFWTDGRLVFGFMPMALFWHACISIAARVTWWLATKIAWPVTDSSFDANIDTSANDQHGSE